MKIRTVMTAVVAVALVSLATQSADAQLQNNLFPQYYTQGAGETAAMYPSPHFVPRHVGHTYGTYQPLMPHEMLYQHSRNYFNYYGSANDFFQHPCSSCRGGGGGGGMNKTSVRWQAGCNFMAPLPGNRAPFAGISYALAKHRYSRGLSGCANGSCGSSGYEYGGGCASGSCAKLTDEDVRR